MALGRQRFLLSLSPPLERSLPLCTSDCCSALRLSLGVGLQCCGRAFRLRVSFLALGVATRLRVSFLAPGVAIRLRVSFLALGVVIRLLFVAGLLSNSL